MQPTVLHTLLSCRTAECDVWPHGADRAAVGLMCNADAGSPNRANSCIMQHGRTRQQGRCMCTNVVWRWRCSIGRCTTWQSYIPCRFATAVNICCFMPSASMQPEHTLVKGLQTAQNMPETKCSSAARDVSRRPAPLAHRRHLLCSLLLLNAGVAVLLQPLRTRRPSSCLAGAQRAGAPEAGRGASMARLLGSGIGRALREAQDVVRGARGGPLCRRRRRALRASKFHCALSLQGRSLASKAREGVEDSDQVNSIIARCCRCCS